MLFFFDEHQSAVHGEWRKRPTLAGAGIQLFVGLAWWFDNRSLQFRAIHYGMVAISVVQFASIMISLNPMLTLLKAISFAVLIAYALAGRLCFVNHELKMISGVPDRIGNVPDGANCR